MRGRSADMSHPGRLSARATGRRRPHIFQTTRLDHTTRVAVSARVPAGRVQKVPDGFGVKFIFAVEVPIEAAMSQARGGHDPFDRSLRKPLLIEQMGRGLEYSLSRALLVVWRIRHDVQLRQSAITPTKR